MPGWGYPLAGSAAILCTRGLDVIRKEAWPFYRTIFGVRLCWELEEPQGPKGEDSHMDGACLRSRVQGFLDYKVYHFEDPGVRA